MPIESELPAAPELEGYTWRPLRRSDAAAMRGLYLACDEAGGGSDARSVLLYEADFDSPETTPATDTLVAVDGLRVVDERALKALLARRKPGDRLKVHAFRRDELLEFALELDAPPATEATLTLAPRPGARAARLLSQWLGRERQARPA